MKLISLRFRQGPGRGLLKRSADLTAITIRQIGALDHQEISHTLNRIHPGLGSPGTPVPEGPGR